MDKDIIILGGGPAGLTAGIYASRARIPSIVIEKGLTGGQMAATEHVDNYPGFPDTVLGYELSQLMETQARKFGVEFVNAYITSVERADGGFVLKADSGKVYTCRSLILATGAQPTKMGIPGEEEFAGKGVSYCAVCDGPFFQGLEVAVLGGGDSAVEEAIYLSKFATKVHLIHRRDKFRAIMEIQERALKEPKIEYHLSHVATSIQGTKDVDSITIKSVKDGSEKKLPVEGVFIYIGIQPNVQPYENLVEADLQGFIITDEELKTSVPGVFAVGDVRAKTLRQITTAVGDGALAAFNAQRYLEAL